MHKNRTVQASHFAMTPRADVPRSSFNIENTHKTTIDAGYLYPIYLDEVLPGDTFSLRASLFGRLATPIVPIMDNIHLETFFFFVPMRLLWSNWQKFMGEQDNPGDSISFAIPQVTVPQTIVGGSLMDYFGVPCYSLTANLSINALPFRAYNLIWNEWFRDENLQNRIPKNMGDGVDSYLDYVPRKRGKRPDYFTTCLPWAQKGASVPAFAAGATAPVKTSSTALLTGAANGLRFSAANGGALVQGVLGTSSDVVNVFGTPSVATPQNAVYPNNLYADLSASTSTTINQLRQAFQIQKLLERDARGGTRYTEIVRAHFGVISPDARLQRPEYLGGGHTMVNVSAVAQTSATGVTGSTTPMGFLSAMGTMSASHHGFTQSFTEHGYVIGLVSVRADLGYQQGLRKLWSRRTRYDFYFPVFAMLGEQAVLNKEIFCDGSANDDAVFGYQERWAEYRWHPSYTSNLMRSRASGTLDAWHLMQNFTALPTLNSTFIEDTPPIDRIVATTPSTGKQFLLDCFFSCRAARPLPAYSVPGLVDHF